MRKRTEKADFQQYFDHITQLDKVIQLSILGLIRVAGSVPLAEALEKLPRWILYDDDAEEGADEKLDLELMKEQAAFAQAEVESDFPILHANALVSQWGALEALVTNLAVRRIKIKRSILQQDVFAKLKIPFAEFERLDEDDRLQLLIQEVSRESGAIFRSGVARFEKILSTVGLAGTVDDETKRTLFELSQVRNVLVHRLGIADRRLLEACPWLDLKRGDRLAISHDDYLRYRNSVGDYVGNLIERAGGLYGIEEEEDSAAEGPAD